MGHQGGLIILHCSALLCCGRPIKSPPDEADGQYHLLPFLGEIISSASRPQGWMFTAAVAFLPSGCGMLMLVARGVKLPETPKKTYRLGGAAHDVPSVGTCNKHQILRCI